LFRVIIAITFLESIATMVQRGVSFYAEHRLGFTRSQNLSLGLLFGVMYIGGALSSHRMARKLGERRWLRLAVSTQILILVGLCFEPGAIGVFVLLGLFAWVSGSKWPVIQSYVGAGLTPQQASKSIGHFNIAWSISVVPAVAVGGFLIETWAPGLFLLPAVICGVVLLLTIRLPARPIHLPQDHPQRPTIDQITRLKSLLVSSRWLLFANIALMFLLAPLLPYIFKDHLNVQPARATLMASLIDLARLLTFVVMQQTAAWHGRRSLLVCSIVLMPVGFFMVLAGDGLAVILIGEVLFGIVISMTYYAALYYAMVIKNASVDAGGGHEGLIGSGLAVGPAIGLGGVFLAGHVGGANAGTLLTVAPLMAICAVASLWALPRGRGTHKARPSNDLP
jgi:predicted MFS family arabinose efflux permease